MESNGDNSTVIVDIPPSGMEDEDDVTVVMVQIPAQSPEELEDLFDEADENKDGCISPGELQAMIEKKRLSTKPIPGSVLKRIYDDHDKNRDGGLSREEFQETLNDPHFGKIFSRYANKYVKLIVPRSRLQGADETDYTCTPPKLGMVIISVIELIFFVIDEFSGANYADSALGPMAQLFLYDPTKRYQFWRYVTYIFVHVGYVHLVVNLVVQILVGIPLEMTHRWRRVFLVYLAGTAAGSLATSITDPTSKLAGASGGVYSLVTAHMATLIMNWTETHHAGFQFAVLLGVTFMDVSNSIYSRYSANAEDQIGYVSHFGGAVAGLLVGIAVLKNVKVTFKENILWWIAVAVYVILMLVGICWNIFYGSHFPEQV